MSGHNPETGFLTGRTALITGGAKRIGAAIASALAAQGAAVVIHYRESSAEAKTLAEELRRAGVEAFLVAGDLANSETAAGLVGKAALIAGKPLDILVNNASAFEPGGLEKAGSEQWDRHQAVNLRAPLLLAQSFSRQLSGNSPADIINLNDVRALRPDAEYLAYTASKVGLHGLTKRLALELAPRARVNELALGPVLPPVLPSGEYEHVPRQEIPTGEFPTVAQVTDSLLFLLRNQAVTGQTICVDGGRHLL